jgi:DNA-binding transcriptional ArsR family regulator
MFMARNSEKIVAMPTRLRIVLHLVEHGGTAKFVDIAKALGASSGAVSVHGRRLADAGMIRIRKQFVDRLPVTTFELLDAAGAPWRTVRPSWPSSSRGFAPRHEKRHLPPASGGVVFQFERYSQKPWRQREYTEPDDPCASPSASP